MESINNRRTIRKYKQEDISASLLNDLLEKAFRASTMGNMQLYSVIVTRDKQMKERLAPAHFNQPMVTGAPVVLTFCADFNRFSKWCRERKAVPGYDNPISFLNAATDALLVTQNFCTLAEENGLGICFLGTTIYNPDQIIDILQLPELVMPVATITVGYPDECPPQVDRLPIEGICMKNCIMIIPKRILIVFIDIKSHFRKIISLLKKIIRKHWLRYLLRSDTRSRIMNVCL